MAQQTGTAQFWSGRGAGPVTFSNARSKKGRPPVCNSEHVREVPSGNSEGIMDTNTLVIVILVVLLLGGGGFFFRGRG